MAKRKSVSKSTGVKKRKSSVSKAKSSSRVHAAAKSTRKRKSRKA